MDLDALEPVERGGHRDRRARRRRVDLRGEPPGLVPRAARALRASHRWRHREDEREHQRELGEEERVRREQVGPLRADLAYGEAVKAFRMHLSVGIAF